VLVYDLHDGLFDEGRVGFRTGALSISEMASNGLLNAV